MPTLLDGKKLREQRVPELIARVAALSRAPKLVIIQVGDMAASNTYIKNKIAFGASIGVEVEHATFPADAKESDIASAISAYNADSRVSGIIIQLPVSEGLSVHRLIEAIDPRKDVDGLTSKNTQHLIEDDESFLPATTKGILTMLANQGVDLSGKKAVIVGRSALVGRPTALAFLNRGATVTVCHSRTVDLAAETRRADILVVAVGRPGLIGPEHVSKGQVIIDVGINVVENTAPITSRRLVGDVDFDAVSEVLGPKGAITPVPGGVGPMTVLSLFENVILAAELAENHL